MTTNGYEASNVIWDMLYDNKHSYSYWYPGYSIPEKMALAMYCISFLVEMAIQTTLNVLNMIAALLFETLKKRIKKLSRITSYATYKTEDFLNMSEELEKWRRHQDLLCQLVERIHDCFGLMMFFTIGHVFVSSCNFTSDTIGVYFTITPGKFFDNIYFWLKHLATVIEKTFYILLRFLFMLIPSHLLQNEVIVAVFKIMSLPITF